MKFYIKKSHFNVLDI